MKRFCFFTALLFLMGGLFSANAQDLIVLRDGSMIESKVVEISRKEIRFKRFEHLDGPVIALSIKNAISVRYESGKLEYFIPSEYAMDPDILNFGISLNPAGLIPFAGGSLSLSLDFNKGRFNTQIDFRSGFGVFSSGLLKAEVYEFLGISASINYFFPTRIGGFYMGILLLVSLGEDHSYPAVSWDDDFFYAGFGLAYNFGFKFITRFGMYFRTGYNVGFTFGLGDMILRPDISFGYNFSKKKYL